MRDAADENGSYFFVVVGHRTCWKCHRDTSVVALGIPYGELLPMDDDGLYPLCDSEQCDSLALLPRINSMPKELRDFLEDKYGYKPKHSKTTGLLQLNNCCDHCGALEGEFFDFQEPDGPFFITGEPDLEQLTFYKVEIPGLIYGSVGTYSNFDGLALRYANGHATPLKLGIFEDLFI